MAQDTIVHANTHQRGTRLLGCGEPRVRGVLVTGDLSKVTCKACKGEKKGDK